MFFLNEVCFAFRVIYVNQLKNNLMTVIKFWISIHVFFQQNSKEHQLKQSLPVALVLKLGRIPHA